MAEQVSAKLTVLSGAGINLKGDYVTALDPTNFKCNWLEIVLTPVGTIANTKVNIDVAIGADGVEVDKIIEFPFRDNSGQSGNNQGAYNNFSLPFEFDSGVRLAVRCCDPNGNAISYTVTIRIIAY